MCHRRPRPTAAVDLTSLTESQCAEKLFPFIRPDGNDINLSAANNVGLSYFTIEQILDNEIANYLRPIGNGKDSVNPHEWWNDNKKSFPKLALIANKFLCSPPSSVESERTFSIGGQTYAPKRSKLLPDTSSKLIQLSFNMRHFTDISSCMEDQF